MERLEMSCIAAVGIPLLLLVALLFIYRVFFMRRKTLYFDSLNEKHVVITGGSSGIGLALARRCVMEGAFVTLMARNKDNLSKAREDILRICNTSNRILLKVVDVSDALTITTAIQEAFQWRPIDILICNAGISKAGLLEQLTTDELDTMFHINLMGSVYPVHAALPLMKQRSLTHPSSIVFVNSLSSLSFLLGAGLYYPTKCAQRGLAELLRMELMRYNIRVTLACPGFTETSMLDEGDKLDPSLLSVARKICFFDRKRAQTTDIVAFRTMEGVKKGEFLITTSMQGMILGVLGRGTIPAELISRRLLELFLMIPVRVFTFPFYIYMCKILKIGAWEK